ncbi:MAG: heavy-metal-associated domain-containing protein [Spirochaetes bacterium]|nr:heavy-metal-associated domain-containing protein [Spirochaetota bacterium]
MKTTIELIAPAMSCGHCKAAIESAVSGLRGIEKVTADPATKRVSVTFDGSMIDSETIRKEIEEAGYATEPAGQ